MVQYEFAPAVEAVAQQVMEEVPGHQHLRRARIAYLFRLSETSPWRAKVWRVPEMYRLLSGYDLVLAVWHLSWKLLDESGRRALIDHEFCHIAPDGEGGWRLVGHDVEEFAGVVERRGLWDAAVQRMAAAARPHLEQAVFEEVASAVPTE